LSASNPPLSGRPAAAAPAASRASRRHALIGVAALLTGCGFELRRAPELHFRSVQLVGFRPRSPLATELRATIDATPTTRVVDALPQAEVVLEALTDAREKSVVASTAVGQVTELQLRARFRFRLRNAAGKELIAPTEILQTRDLSYTESAALAKELEEASLYRAMQTDIVSQVMRRLASVPSA
jgi:LPS-assembly lipoprotein